MELESIKQKHKLREGALCIQTNKWEDEIEFYGLKGEGVKIPYEKIDNFIKELKNKLNGEEVINLQVNEKNYVKIPKSKIEELEINLKKTEYNKGNYPLCRRVF
jgi:hypothetical protein